MPSSFAVASPQRAKVRGRTCLRCGATGPDPAHLWDRGKDGHGGCDHPDCVIPLCRECHREYDERAIDLLPQLVSGGYFTELAHPISEHYVSPTKLIDRVTGGGSPDRAMEAIKPLLRAITAHRTRAAATSVSRMVSDSELYEAADIAEQELAIAGLLGSPP